MISVFPSQAFFDRLQDMVNQFLALSLFIMMLSFFIILNTLSNFEEVRSKPVLNSIALAFSNQKDYERTDAGMDRTDIDSSVHTGDALDNLEGLFRAQIAGLDVRKNRLGTMMHIRMSREKFEKVLVTPDNPGQKTGSSFMPTLVSIVQSQDTIPYRMDIVLNIPDNPPDLQNNEPAEALNAVRRSAVYTQSLEDAGLPSKLVTAGLGAGPEETVDVYFHRYEPFRLEGAETEEEGSE